MSRAALVAAEQAALAGEHATVWGYGVVGARLSGAAQASAAAALAVHLSRRDRLAGWLTAAGVTPVAALPGYALPFPVPDPAAALRLAGFLEDGTAGVYYDLVGAATGPVQVFAAEGLQDAATRGAGWRALAGDLARATTAFPGQLRTAPT